MGKSPRQTSNLYAHTINNNNNNIPRLHLHCCVQGKLNYKMVSSNHLIFPCYFNCGLRKYKENSAVKIMIFFFPL